MKDNSVDALILNITEVVLRTHFYYVTDRDLQQDLMQEGYLKAYELLSSGNYDPYRNLRTFIYTGVRNAMTNYMYHTNKESHDTVDMIDSSDWQQYQGVANDNYYENKVYYYDEIEPNYSISLTDITNVTDKYSMFGNYTKNAELYFKQLGIYYGNSENVKKEEENELVLDAIKGEIIWNIFNRNF